nr:polyamine transporter 4 [Quercus suber]POE94788.1 polyamine transporter 4 [Quercus suber]
MLPSAGRNADEIAAGFHLTERGDAGTVQCSSNTTTPLPTVPLHTCRGHRWSIHVIITCNARSRTHVSEVNAAARDASSLSMTSRRDPLTPPRHWVKSSAISAPNAIRSEMEVLRTTPALQAFSCYDGMVWHPERRASEQSYGVAKTDVDVEKAVTNTSGNLGSEQRPPRSPSTSSTSDGSAQHSSEDKSPAVASALDWDGSGDPDDPHNWRKWKRIYHTFVVAAVALTCTIASSIYTPGRQEVQDELRVSYEVALLPYVLFVLGLACGPMISAPISEHFGRRAVFLVGMPVLGLFTVGAGFSTNIASLTACRFFAGLFASPPLAIGSATISDLWSPSERAIPMAIYVTTPFLGPAIGYVYVLMLKRTLHLSDMRTTDPFSAAL